jgi:hypothetical protein
MLTMKLDRYPYYADSSFFDFEFESEGSKGKIRKIARFIKIGQNLYSFGVAHIVHDFTSVFSDAAIYIEGSTPSRTRWYQMNIAAYLAEIDAAFEIYGFENGQWESFKKGINYKAFMGRRRQF